MRGNCDRCGKWSINLRTFSHKKIDYGNICRKCRNDTQNPKQREEKKREAKEFIKRHGINLNVCSVKEKAFLNTIFIYEQNIKVLSEKQQNWFDDIIKRSKKNESRRYLSAYKN